MQFSPPLASATFVQRYKRFVADVSLPNGDLLRLHCPNTGSMKNCLLPGAPVWYSKAANPARKYAFTWQVIEVAPGVRIGINTHVANVLVAEAIENGVITELQGYTQCRREVTFGESRLDFLLSNPNQECYVEVKNVTLWEHESMAYFPDAVSVRATKHIKELMHIVARGARAVLVFCVQHTGVNQVTCADQIDPQYGIALREAVDKGVEVIAYQATIEPDAIQLQNPLPIVL